MSTDPYYDLPKVGPYEVRIGSALITMVEPHVGHERAYNRWYEDDHYYAGAMAMPWMFAGPAVGRAGRAAEAALPGRLRRSPSRSRAGKYISTYWITEGRYEDHMRWTVSTNQRLLAEGRVFQERDARVHRRSSATGARGTATPSGPRDIHALDHPYGGLVVEVIDSADAAQREQLLYVARRRPRADVIARQPRSRWRLAFQPEPLPGDKQPYMKDVEGVDDRLTVLWLTEGDPARRVGTLRRRRRPGRRVGPRQVQLMAPFVPTVPGTDRYVDRLR